MYKMLSGERAWALLLAPDGGWSRLRAGESRRHALGGRWLDLGGLCREELFVDLVLSPLQGSKSFLVLKGATQPSASTFDL